MCDRFVFTQTQTNCHAPTHRVVAHPSVSPVCPALAPGQQVSHREGTWLTLSCWQWHQAAPPPPPSNTHRHMQTTPAHKHTLANVASTHTEGNTQLLACLSFMTGWQRAAGFTPTQLCNPLALSSINLCNIKHKHAHKPAGIQYVWGETERITYYCCGGDRCISFQVFAYLMFLLLLSSQCWCTVLSWPGSARSVKAESFLLPRR